MTSGAQPCIPAAPCGAEDARTSLRTIAGRISVISCATKLPIENPRMSAWRAAHAGVIEGHDPPARHQCVDQRRVPAVEIPAEVLQQNQRHLTVAGLAVGVLDAVRSADELVRERCVRRGHRRSTSHRSVALPCDRRLT
jgi:hypothetical protein